MIHVCFALYDPARHYSKFTGTAILSLFENTNSKVTVHFLHDNTLTDDNREKFIQIAERYGQILKFYNVEELCTKDVEKIKEYFPNVGVDRHSIATFYRFFIMHLLPQEIEKVIYLDSDIIVNLDITEFWQIELRDKPFGAVPEFYQISDRDVSIKNRKKYITICTEGVVNPEDYFNAGVMLINLKMLREEKATISAGMKFISEHPQFKLLDQDILNYCFSTTYLKLPLKFNRFVLRARTENEWSIEKKIYHYATSRTCLVMDSRDPYNQLFMSYFMKTPWVDADTKAPLFGTNIPSLRNYAVSVVIPMYNVEEFIGECLDSLLMQTLQDFEVIVVDDCSTDDSVKIVQEYAPKFNGRLYLTNTEKNSDGGGNVPRNMGLMFASGDYIYFMDADDMILNTALETFYKAAILYDAEVVYTASRYNLRASNDIYLRKDDASKKMIYVNTDLTIDDPQKNLDRLLLESKEGNFRSCWTKFVRRDFLIKNKIFFPNIPNSGDFIWVINLYCHARRFLRISTPLYFYRNYNINSIWQTVKVAQEQCRCWFASFVDFVKALNELEKENEIFTENPLYGLAALKIHFSGCLDRTEDARKELGSEEIYKILRSEFAKASADSLELIFPFIISFIEYKKTANFFESMDKFKDYVTARIDIKLAHKSAGDFQILSLSDKNVSVAKPAWLQKGGSGYQIQSYAGDLKFVAKSSIDGTISLDLKSLDIRDPADKSKRIPYWIDYTRLTINEQAIFDTITPAWHDKFYRHIIDAKAGEEIKIQIEWLPHRSDT